MVVLSVNPTEGCWEWIGTALSAGVRGEAIRSAILTARGLGSEEMRRKQATRRKPVKD